MGGKKTGGRKKGSKNKGTKLLEAQAAMRSGAYGLRSWTNGTSCCAPREAIVR